MPLLLLQAIKAGVSQLREHESWVLLPVICHGIECHNVTYVC